MVGLAENIQACLRISRRAQHQWLVRDILHPSQGVYYVFVLWPHRKGIRPIRLIRGRKNPQDRGGADTQVAPVGRLLTWLDDKRMGGI